MQYKVSKSLVIQFNEKGQLVATVSMSRRPKKITPDVLFVLEVFGKNNTPEGAMKTLAEECEFEEEGFREVFDDLVKEGFLVAVDNESRDNETAPKTRTGFGSLGVHHYMLKDSIRVLAYRNAIFNNVKGKSVVEIGCGSGILSLFAAQAGAKKVIAIEETGIANLAREMIKANGFENIITVISSNSRDVELDEPADVIIHEIIGNEPFGEKMLPTLADARDRLLADKKGRFLPGKLDVCCVATEIDQKLLIAQGGEKDKREALEFSHQYGLDFGPYIDLLSGEKETPRLANYPQDTTFPFTVLAGEHLLYSVDFAAEWEDVYALKTHTLEMDTPGTMNAVTIFFRAHLDEKTQLTNSPFAPKTHWGWSIRPLPGKVAVNPGDKIKISTQLKVGEYDAHRMEVDWA
ncbi:MAG: methyltransferase [bacterium]|nr:methyltransferase [bacterium]